MGDKVALSDAEALTNVIDIGVDDLVNVEEGVGVVLQARLGIGPCCVRWEDFERHAVGMPADAAVGLAPKGVVETRFSEGEQQSEVIPEGFGAARERNAAGHREDDPRPEAGEKSEQGRSIAQQPKRGSSDISWA